MQLNCIMNNIKPEEILKSSKLKVTEGRLGILEILSKAEYPVDAGLIETELKHKKIRLDMVTVYRILDKFLQNKIIEKVEFQEGKYRYEMNYGKHHHHAVCVKCGSVKEIDKCGINYAEENLLECLQFKVQRHRMEFFGLCQKCQ